jgi:hypothetical protein
MPAEILGPRFHGVRRPIWMDFCKEVSGKTAVEALNETGLNRTVTKEQLFYSYPDKFGQMQEQVIDGQFAIILKPDESEPYPRSLGIVGNDFTPVQNIEVARAVDLITDTYPVVACGGIKDGGGLFFSLDAGETCIKGDTIHNYLNVSDFKGGGKAYKIFFNPNRMYCGNQLITSFRSASIAASMAHFNGAQDNMILRIKLLKQLKTAQANILSSFERLATTSMNAMGFRRMIEAAYPYPKRPRAAELVDEQDSLEVEQFGAIIQQATTAQEKWEWQKSRVEAFRSTAGTLLERFNDLTPTVANTWWAGWNVIVESADYREGNGDIAYSTLFQTRAAEKIRAYEVAIRG